MATAYQGSDLSLRTPKAWNGPREVTTLPELPMEAPEWLARALSEAATQGPEIWVDNTVLKCCNQAYEIAVAHRAPEVRLEHLVHAMTLVPAAVAILQSEGISDATLRRESGVIIAHDLPSVSSNGPITPKTSDEMEEVLRFAADAAYQHRSPVTVDDILQTLFDMKRDIPTRNLLSRHRDDWTIREAVDTPARRYSKTSWSQTTEAPTVTDTFQNSRLNELEREVAELRTLLAQTAGVSEPETTTSKTTATSHQTNGSSSYTETTEVVSQILQVEASLDRKFRELARTWNVLGDRLQTVEDILVESEHKSTTQVVSRAEWERLVNRLERLTKLEQFSSSFESIELLPERLEKLEVCVARIDRFDELVDKLEQLQAFVTKLEWMEKVLIKLERFESFDVVERRLKDVETTFTRVLSRIDTFESRVDRVMSEFDLKPINECLTRIEAYCSGEGPRQTIDLDRVHERFDRIERSVQTHSSGVIDLTPIDERMKDVRSQIVDQSLVFQSIGDRIDTFESNVDATRTQLTQLTTQLASDLRSVSAKLEAQQHSHNRMCTLIEERLNGLTAGGGMGTIDTGLITSSVETQLTSTLSEIKTLISQDRDEQRDQFQYLVSGFDRIANEYRQDLTEVHEALIKLNSNQQTLAESMDTWRKDMVAYFERLTTRVESVEEKVGEPVSAIEGLRRRFDEFFTSTTRYETHSYTNQGTYTAPEQYRDSFAYWLFGTENWWSDGWRTAEERAEIRRREQFERTGEVDGTTTAAFTPFQDPTQRRLHG